MRHRRLVLIERPLPEACGPSSSASGRWASPNAKIDDDNLLWRQYVIFVDLYRYYIDLAWKVSVWFYTAIGVSLVYFFSHFNSGNRGYLPFLLLFLGSMSIGVSWIFGRVVHYVTEMEKWLDYIAVSLSPDPPTRFRVYRCSGRSAPRLALLTTAPGKCSLREGISGV